MEKPSSLDGTAIAIGMAIGVAIGVALDNIGAGIGIDTANLRELARRTNGKVISPTDTDQIMPTLWRDAALTPWLCGLAVVLIGWALLHWKRA